MMKIPEEVEKIAEAHHGAARTSDLRAAGLSPAMQLRRVEAGLITVPLRGVVVLCHLTDRVTPVAALQLRYPSLVAERRTAAALLGLDGFRDPGPLPLDLVDVWHDRPPTATGLPRIRTAALPARAVTEWSGVRITTPTWTLGEVGASPGIVADHVELALECALHRGLTTEAKLWRVTQTRTGPGWPGTSVLEGALARRRRGDPPTESYAETRFLQLVVRALGLEDPERQVSVVVRGRRTPYRCDFVFRRSRMLDVEIDGMTTHATEVGRDHDSVRDHEVEQQGFEVVRFGAARIEHHPAQIMTRLMAELAAVA